MDKQSIRSITRKQIFLGYHTFLFCCACLFFSSCAPIKNSYYFKTLTKDTSINSLVSDNLDSKIAKGDKLAIAISSLNLQEDIVFNTGATVKDRTDLAGFPVGDDGNITIHKVGKFKAEGLTRKELAVALEAALAPYLKDAIVTVQYLNHKVTILGEVVRPQVINMPEEQLSIIDVLVIGGDVTANASRRDIMIIRENGAEKKVKHLNLEDHSVFASPWYYVQPNDIVVVSPDFVKTNQEKRTAKFQTYFGIALSAISLVIVVLDRLLR